jgi:hypothetical protein
LGLSIAVAFLSFRSAIIILMIITVFEFVGNFSKGRKTEENLFIWAPIILVLVIYVLPFFDGLVQAKYDIKDNEPDSYNITLSDSNKFDKAKFIYYGKDNYFFIINNRLNIIPKDQIKLLEENK